MNPEQFGQVVTGSQGFRSTVCEIFTMEMNISGTKQPTK